MIPVRFPHPFRQALFASIALLLIVGHFHVQSSARLVTPTPKYTSCSIAITPDGVMVLAVNPDSNSVTLVDTSSDGVIAELEVGVDPRSVAISAEGNTAIVANQGSNSLSIIYIPSRIVTASLEVGSRPVGVAFSPDGRFVAVAELGDDRVRLLNPADLSTHALLPVADRPYGLAFTPDSSRLLITHLLSGNVTVMYLHPSLAFIPLVQRDSQVVYSVYPQDQAAQIGFQYVLRSIETWPNIAPAPTVIVNATGTRAYLPQTMANGLGLNTQFDTSIFPKVSVLDLESNRHQTSEHISLPETDQPVGLPWDAALGKNGTELWVVNSASNDVSVIDITNPSSSPGRLTFWSAIARVASCWRRMAASLT